MASSHSSSHSSSSSSRRSNLNIHKIREFELEKVYQVFQLKFSTKLSIIYSVILLTQVHLMDEFDILQIVGEGWFGKILLVEHKATDTEMVLKGILFALNILIALTIQVLHFKIYTLLF